MTDSCVKRNVVLRTSLFVAILALAAPACGGKSKKDDTSPAADTAGTGGADGSGVRPEDIEPVADDTDMGAASDDDDAATAGATGGDTDGDEGAADDGGAAGDTDSGSAPATPAKLEPPGLDKSPEEVRIAVGGHLKTGNSALRTKRWDDAIVAARAALEEDEVNVRAMTMLAHAYVGKAYYDKAEAILDIAAKRPDGPRNPKLHFLYGIVYDKTARADKALVAYEKAVQAKPDYMAALLNVGAKYIRKGRYTDAIATYEKLTGTLGDNRPEAWSNLGAAYRGRSADLNSDKTARSSFLRKAENAYKRAVNADNKHGNAYYNLGLLYLDADPYPAPDGKDMDTLKRLERAKTYFNEYRGMPGADQDLVDEQVTVAEKLH